MKLSLLIAPIAILCSCGTEKPAETQAPPQAKPETHEPAAKSGEVRFDETALKQANISTVPVRLQSLPGTIVANGHLVVNDDQTWRVGSIVDGKVIYVSATVGDSVKKGQVLARVHSHDVHEARAAYQRATEELQQKQSQQSFAQKSRDRAKRLLELKAISQEQVEQAENELRTAQSGVTQAKTDVEKEKVHITEFLGVAIEGDDHPTEAGVIHEADLAPIQSPAAGLVLQRKITAGSVLKAGDEMFVITNPASLWMIASVNEADLGQLRVGQRVRILVRAYPDQPFSGRVLKLGEELDPETRTLKVRVALPNPNGKLKPEMYATAEIDRGSTRQALFIPEAAAQEVNGQRVVFVRKPAGVFELRNIQVARTMAGQMEVSDGLRAGEEVVIRGAFLLKSELLKKSLEEE